MQEYKKISSKKFPKALIEVRPSRILRGQQISIFAVRFLKKGTIIGDVKFFDEEEFLLTWEEYKKIDKETQEIIYNYCLGTPDGFCVPKNLNYISIPWNFNHSCSGKVGFDKKNNFIMREDAEKGEELFYDYGLAEANPDFKMKCLCRSKNCRKFITGNDWKNAEFRKRNLKYMISELRKMD